MLRRSRQRALLDVRADLVGSASEVTAAGDCEPSSHAAAHRRSSLSREPPRARRAPTSALLLEGVPVLLSQR
eukprot:13490595-Alexandrium_andersonii.AAC.1